MPQPSEFYVGVVDLFAVLLPGAIATGFLIEPGRHLLEQARVTGYAPGEWAGFIICSYFLGHVIFYLGSLLDDYADELRDKRRARELANKKPRKTREVEQHLTFECAKAIQATLMSETELASMKTHQWCRSILIATTPAAAEDVHRLEADSKFFRSLIAVCILVPFLTLMPRSLLAFEESRLVVFGIGFSLAILCFIRYYTRRIKCHTQAFIHVIALHGLKKI